MTAGLVDFRPSNVDSAGWVTFAETRYDVGLTFAVAVAESVELAEEEAVLEIHAAPCLAVVVAVVVVVLLVECAAAGFVRWALAFASWLAAAVVVASLPSAVG